MGDQAVGRRHDVVGVLGPEAGHAVGGRGDSHGRAVAEGFDAAAPLDDRVVEPAGAAERIEHDGDPGVALGVDGEVLPTTPAAAGAARRARRDDPVR